MKKNLLVVMMACMVCTVVAQEEDLFGFEPGVYTETETGVAVFDDFATEVEYGDENAGIYWWSEETSYPDSEYPNHSAVITRNADDGRLDAVVTQGLDEMGPFGFVFGGGEGVIGGEEEPQPPVELDFTNDFTYSMAVTNNSDYDLVFRLMPRDINGNILNTDSAWASEDLGNAFMYAIEVVVPSGETDTLQVGVSREAWPAGPMTGPLSGSFEGGLYAEYTDNNEAHCEPESYETDFDLSRVVGFNISVFNFEDTGDAEDCSEAYMREPINEAEVSINWVKVGNAAQTQEDPDEEEDEEEEKTAVTYDFDPGIYADEAEGIAVYDDFATEMEYGNEDAGMFWWSQEEADPESEHPNHSATITRNPDGDNGQGRLDAVVTQGLGEMGSFGFVFGGGEEVIGGEEEPEPPVTLDFTNDFTYSMAVTNNSDYDLVFRLMPRDIDGNILDTDSAWASDDLSEFYMYAIEVVVSAHSTDTLQAGVSIQAWPGGPMTGPLSGSFEGALFADYTDDDPADCDPESHETNFDPTRVVGFNITVINLDDTGEAMDCREAYLREPINEAAVSINWVKVGALHAEEEDEDEGEDEEEEEETGDPYDFAPGIYRNFDEGIAMYDDFAQAQEYTDGMAGLYWWSTEEAGADEQNPEHAASLMRNHMHNKMDVIVSQGLDETGSFGVVFGTDDFDDPITLDFTQDFVYSMVVTNTGDEPLRVRLSPRDLHDNILDTDAAWQNAEVDDAIYHTIEVLVEPNETDTLQVGTSQRIYDSQLADMSEPLSGTFEDALRADYPKGDDFEGNEDFSDHTTCSPERVDTFDPTQVKGFNVTVIHAWDKGMVNDNDCRTDLLNTPIENATLSIHEVRVGKTTSNPITAIMGEEEQEQITLYPNPASRENNVRFSEEVTNVMVYDGQGNQVFSANALTILNTGHLQSGLYIIRTDQGNHRLLIE